MNTTMTRRDALRLLTAAGIGQAVLPGAWAQSTAPAIPPRDEVELTNELLRVVLSPSDGAGVLAFAVKKDGKWVDLYPDVRDPVWKMRYASWMMIPYSNRIENGVFRFEGKEHKLRSGANHAIHGDARSRAWKVVEKKADRIKLALRSGDFADFNWPWPIDIEAELAIEEHAFVQRLQIVNRGDTKMPAGFGWHPYYRRTLTKAEEPVLLQANFTGVYPDANGDCIPDGPPAKPAPELDYSKPRPVPLDLRHDTCCSGFDGKATIEWPQSGVKLAYACAENVTHFVYFNPTDRPVWAAEPAANANNGVNLLDRGDTSHGVIVVPAGEAVRSHFTTHVTA